MPQLTTSLDRIAALQAEIESLQETAVRELREKRTALAQELDSVNDELARLTGSSSETKTRSRRGPAAPGRALPLQELKDLLARAPEKTLNIRKDRLDLGSIKTLAAAHPEVLRLGGRGAWPTVSLVK